ncbi:MAG: HAMP domain-containing sensor histidine kinase [Thermotogota bacterium]
MKNKTIRGYFLMAFIISFFSAIIINFVLLNIYSKLVFEYRKNSINEVLDNLKNHTEEDHDLKKAFNNFVNSFDLGNSTVGIINEDKKLIASNKPINNISFDKFNFDKFNFENNNFLEFTSYDFKPDPPFKPAIKKEQYIYIPFKNNNNQFYLIIDFEPGKTIGMLLNRDTMFFISMISSIIIFLIIFYLITNKKIKYINKISKEISKKSFGKLDHKLEVKGNDEIAEIIKNINYMSEEISNQIENEREAEKEKYELISNISHDLRTPLTSVIGYLDLIKKTNYDDKNQLKEYSNIAHRKSIKIKELVDNLFEFTKYNNKDIQISKMRVNLNDFIEQFIYEMSDYEKKYNKKLKKHLCNEDVYAELDPQLYFRVFQNLCINAFKYSKNNSDIDIIVSDNIKEVTITISNYTNDRENIDIDKIFNRFYKEDKSRSTIKGGSGLGLSIVKSILDTHQHDIIAKKTEDIISFKIIIKKNKREEF